MRRVVFLLFLSSAAADFTPDFSEWLKNYYGQQIRDQMERKDLGWKGSFGGKLKHDDTPLNQPVVFVHGVSDTSGEKMTQAANWFKNHGKYKQSELYSTTYYDGAQGNPLKWTAYTMKCEFVKQVRSLIVAVRLYTGRQVDVVGFSLGVPVSRKAILGGYCVDTGEYLGGPLTKFVDTYVGVAGPNKGVAQQLGAIAIPGCALGGPGICNQLNGLYSGNCPQTSRYLQDINSVRHYEGQHVYSIYTKKDQMVGFMVCGERTSQVPGQDGDKMYEDYNHDQVFHETHNVQMNMIKEHKVIGK